MEESIQPVNLTILPHGWQCPIANGQSILEAALAAGIRLPSSCRNGTCRACICKLVEGEITYRIEWPGLSFDEKADAWMLPCVAVVAVVSVASVGAMTQNALVIQAPLAVKVSDED